MQNDEKSATNNSALDTENKAFNRVHILVVDDEDTIRSLLFDVLSGMGYNVEVASSGEEALEKIKHTLFEILITDLRMPGMDGFEVTKKLKEINSNICIIVITGYPSIETAIEAMRHGAYDYITKPFKLDELRIIVNRAAEKQILQREREVYKELSITDGLTGIYNQRYFQEIMPREMNRSDRYAHPLSLAMIDIDDFKIYNDTNGHLAGDEVLKTITRLFSESIRKTDFLFRYGGEEFVILLPETGKEAIAAVARRIRGLVEETEFKDAHVFPNKRLTVSIGLAVYPEDVKLSDELIAKADQALYHAKRLGKNRVCLFEIQEIKVISEE